MLKLITIDSSRFTFSTIPTLYRCLLIINPGSRAKGDARERRAEKRNDGAKREKKKVPSNHLNREMKAF